MEKKTDQPYVIVRTYSAGAFAANLVSRDGKEAKLANARRLWYWDGAASLSQIAVSGVSKPFIAHPQYGPMIVDVREMRRAA
jgi:hypothetical protein